MTYQVLIDGKDLYYPGDEEYSIAEGVLTQQLNDSGTFVCGVPATNLEYNNIKNRRSMLQILKDEKEIFCGEVRESEKDFYGTKEIYAVGELAFLFDSIQPQAKFQDKTARELLEIWLDEHNGQVEEKKRFYVGIVTVHDINDSLYRFTNQETTLDCIREKLCKSLGGYLKIRKENGKRYLDLLSLRDYGKICTQIIEFGENLLDYSENVSANDLCTVVIPRGARLEESLIEGLDTYADITSVNDGLDYLYIPEAVEHYGWVRRVVTWDDVHVPSKLKTKGLEWLTKNQYETMVLNLTAVDLSLLNTSFDSYGLGDIVQVHSVPHGMNQTFPVQKLEIHLQSPGEDCLQLGDTIRYSYTEQNNGQLQGVKDELEASYERTKWLQSAIDNATAMLTGSKGGYKLEEYDENGLFIRTLYMDAPNKEDAVNIIQIGPQGIGFSRTGFAGPYLSAWTIDGVLLGEFIKAHSIKAEALETEYIEHVEQSIKDAETGAKDWAEDRITTSIKAVESQITLSVETERKRASGVEETLSSRIRVTQNSISSEVSRATDAEVSLSSRIYQTESSISSEVTRAKNAESSLSSRITQTADDISLCVQDSEFTGNAIISKINLSSTTAAISASKVNINADEIRLKASKIAWSSSYSSMTEDGKLTCTGANIKGTFRSESQNSWGTEYMQIKDGILNGGVGSTQHGLLDLAAQYGSGRHAVLKGYDYLHLQAGTKIYIEKATEVEGKLFATSLSAGDGLTGTVSFIAVQSVDSDGTLASWDSSKTVLKFRNGILVG